jgi:hypothetical protein
MIQHCSTSCMDLLSIVIASSHSSPIIKSKRIYHTLYATKSSVFPALSSVLQHASSSELPQFPRYVLFLLQNSKILHLQQKSCEVFTFNKFPRRRGAVLQAPPRTRGFSSSNQTIGTTSLNFSPCQHQKVDAPNIFNYPCRGLPLIRTVLHGIHGA